MNSTKPFKPHYDLTAIRVAVTAEGIDCIDMSDDWVIEMFNHHCIPSKYETSIANSRNLGGTRDSNNKWRNSRGK